MGDSEEATKRLSCGSTVRVVEGVEASTEEWEFDESTFLAVKAGETVEVLAAEGEWLWGRRVDAPQEGWFPARVVRWNADARNEAASGAASGVPSVSWTGGSLPAGELTRLKKGRVTFADTANPTGTSASDVPFERFLWKRLVRPGAVELEAALRGEGVEPEKCTCHFCKRVMHEGFCKHVLGSEHMDAVKATLGGGLVRESSASGATGSFRRDLGSYWFNHLTGEWGVARGAALEPEQRPAASHEQQRQAASAQEQPRQAAAWRELYLVLGKRDLVWDIGSYSADGAYSLVQTAGTRELHWERREKMIRVVCAAGAEEWLQRSFLKSAWLSVCPVTRVPFCDLCRERVSRDHLECVAHRNRVLGVARGVFVVGESVRVVNFSGESWNGQEGFCQSWDELNWCWVVRLHRGGVVFVRGGELEALPYRLGGPPLPTGALVECMRRDAANFCTLPWQVPSAQWKDTGPLLEFCCARASANQYPLLHSLKDGLPAKSCLRDLPWDSILRMVFWRASEKAAEREGSSDLRSSGRLFTEADLVGVLKAFGLDNWEICKGRIEEWAAERPAVYDILTWRQTASQLQEVNRPGAWLQDCLRTEIGSICGEKSKDGLQYRAVTNPGLVELMRELRSRFHRRAGLAEKYGSSANNIGNQYECLFWLGFEEDWPEIILAMAWHAYLRDAGRVR